MDIAGDTGTRRSLPGPNPGSCLLALDVHAGNTLAYPLGGEHGGSTRHYCGGDGNSAHLCRRRRFTLLALLLSPCVMGLVAAGLGQYPYGGAPRLTQYLAPSICVLAGVGASVVVADFLLGSAAAKCWL